jgi:general secretion pathway protein C
MQDLIKRYFWVVGALTVMVCAVFAAKIVNHVVEAKVLGDPTEPRKVTAPAPLPNQPAKVARTKDGGQFATRNMFCSECTPPAVVATNTDPNSIAITSLPLQLLATSVGKTDKDSLATIMNTDSSMGGAYTVGEKLPGASGPIRTIKYQYVDFENNGRIERVMLGGTPMPPQPTAVAVSPPPVAGDDMQASIDSGIKKLNDTTFEIDRALVDKVIANPMAFTKGARVVPAMKNGKPEGIKLYAIRPTSPYAKLGLTNGDTLQSINGFELNSVEKGLEIYGKLREATSLEVEVLRRGKPVTLKYTIR